MKRREANDDEKRVDRREKCANLRGLSIEERASLSLSLPCCVHSAALLSNDSRDGTGPISPSNSWSAQSSSPLRRFTALS